jgi:hypothetical protein
MKKENEKTRATRRPGNDYSRPSSEIPENHPQKSSQNHGAPPGLTGEGAQAYPSPADPYNKISDMCIYNPTKNPN